MFHGRDGGALKDKIRNLIKKDIVKDKRAGWRPAGLGLQGRCPRGRPRWSLLCEHPPRLTSGSGAPRTVLASAARRTGCLAVPPPRARRPAIRALPTARLPRGAMSESKSDLRDRFTASFHVVELRTSAVAHERRSLLIGARRALRVLLRQRLAVVDQGFPRRTNVLERRDRVAAGRAVAARDQAKPWSQLARPRR